MVNPRRNRSIVLSLVLILLLAASSISCAKPAPAPAPAAPQQAQQPAAPAAPAAAPPAPAAPDYPTRPITFSVGHGAGSYDDLVARALSPYLSKNIGQAVVVENQPGSGGRTQRDAVFTSKPDGYTFGVIGGASTPLGEYLYPVKFKTAEFTYVYMLAGNDYGTLLVKKGGKYKTFDDLLQASKSKELLIGTDAGFGSGQHLQSVMMERATGIKYKLIPFESDGEAVAALVGGKIDAAMGSGVATIPGYPEQTSVLVVFADQRVKQLPETPTFKEAGYDGLSLEYYFGIMGPPGIPQNVLNILNAALDKSVKDPNFIKDCEKLGIMYKPLPGPEYKAEMMKIYDSIQKTYGPIVKAQMEAQKKK